MIKAVVWFKRKPGMSIEDARDYWRTEHAAIVSHLPGLRRYVQNPVHDSAYRDGREPMADGVVEVWFDDTDAMRAAAGTDEYAAVMSDEANFIDAASRTELLCDEVVVKDAPPPPGALKYVAFINRRADLDVDEFQRYWREVHGPLAAHNPYIRRYVQNHVRRRFYDSGRVPPFDGVPMTWFTGFDELRASAGTDELRATREDEANFMADGGGRLPFVITTERPIL